MPARARALGTSTGCRGGTPPRTRLTRPRRQSNTVSRLTPGVCEVVMWGRYEPMVAWLRVPVRVKGGSHVSLAGLTRRAEATAVSVVEMFPVPCGTAKPGVQRGQRRARLSLTLTPVEEAALAESSKA